jgi:hypothetical protein
MRFALSIFAIVMLLVASAGPRAAASRVHTFHTSLMQAEFNEKEKTLEISIQVFAHDLETVLTKRAGKRVQLDRSPVAPVLVLAYLSEAVNIRNREGQPKSFIWVGMEPQADAVWLYLESKMPEGVDGAQIRNRIFFDLLDDQVNLVHLKYEGKKADLVFKPGEDFKPVGQPNGSG